MKSLDNEQFDYIKNLIKDIISVQNIINDSFSSLEERNKACEQQSLNWCKFYHLKEAKC